MGDNRLTRTFIKRLKAAASKTEGEELLKNVIGMIDKLAKNNIIHNNKAANLKSKLTKHVSAL